MRRLRAQLDISQQDLAVRIGKTVGAVSQYERGVNTPRRSTAELIDDALDANGEILDGFGYASVSPPGGGQWVSREQFRDLAEKVDRLAEQLQENRDRLERLSRSKRRDAL